MPIINTYYSSNIISEIYNNNLYKTYSNVVYACGNNKYGQLGIGSDSEVIHIPQKVLIEEKIKYINYYNTNVYFITINNEVYACGRNREGSLGFNSDFEAIHIPQKVLIEEKIKYINCCDGIIYFITINDEVYACGNNFNGQLGVGPHDKVVCIPQKVLLEEKIKDIKTFYNLTYFILINDEFYSCGDNEVGQLGVGSYDKVVYIPQKVLIKEKIKCIESDNYHTYFITINDEVYASGNNMYGQLGIGSHNKYARVPQKVLIKERIKYISPGHYQTCFITMNNECYTCGNNKYGNLGIGSYDLFIHIPHKVITVEKIKNVISSLYYTYYITINNEVYKCGANKYRANDYNPQSEGICIPQKVLIKEKIKDIEVLYDQIYFITINNEVYAYGDNCCGQLGVGSHNEFVYIPQKVLIKEKIKYIRTECTQTYFITVNDMAYACGNNHYGQLGIGSRYRYIYIPQKILIEERIKYISPGRYQTSIFLFNDEIYACGMNSGNENIKICSCDEYVYIPQKVKNVFSF